MRRDRGAYSGDDGTIVNWIIRLPQYGGWTVHDTASSAHKQLADAIDKTVADLTSSLDKLMEQWQGTPIPHIKSSMETFISSVQTLAHSVRTASEIHSRQSQIFKELYSYSSEKNSYTLQPSGPDVGQWRFVPSAYEMNCLHKIFAGGSWYDWLSPCGVFPVNESSLF
ncbi:hypothetical protein [Mycobacterium sp.]|uniref:hypothetical protein n=1 Tax=Mycobacterium sp. TaxID=1785 RepID=UPI003BAAE4C7